VPHTTAKSDSYREELVANFMGLLLLHDPARVDETRQELASRLARVEFPDPRGFRMVSANPETTFDGLARVFFGGRSSSSNQSSMADPNWKPTAEVPPSKGATLVASLVVAAGLFMLLPAVNLVNLNVSRIMERATEIGVRKAFGASSLTLVGQFVVENVFLTVIGGLLGFVFSWYVLSMINASNVIPYASLKLNLRVFAYGLGLAVFFGLVSGVYPAWRMSRLDPVQALKGASR
jgi:putative ABC transport system permease protein